MKLDAQVMPQGPADGLLKLLLFNAGFSCKSFSKLHKDYKNLLQAIYEGNEDRHSHDKKTTQFQLSISADKYVL